MTTGQQDPPSLRQARPAKPRHDSKPTPYAGDIGEPYITRLLPGPGKAPGYIVRVPTSAQVLERTGFKTLTRNFTSYTTPPDELLQRARHWRDHWHQTMHGQAVPVRTFHGRQANGTTGVPGVRFIIKKAKLRNGRVRETAVYIAEVWTIPGKDGERPRGSRSRLWSVGLWGEDKAFRLACEWRAAAASALAQGKPLPD